MYRAGLKKAMSCSRLLSLTRNHNDLELLVWSYERHFRGCLVGIHANLKDVARLAMLPMFGDVNA